MAVWGTLESSAGYVADAFEILADHTGPVAFDGLFTVGGFWVLWWYGVDGAGVYHTTAERRQLIRTTSFDRYAAAVVQAIASRRPRTGRKRPAIAPRGANGRIRTGH
jgi:hypothetical protein